MPADALRAPYTVSRISERPEPTRPARPTISPARTSKETSANFLVEGQAFYVEDDVSVGRGGRSLGEDVLDVAAGHQPDQVGGGGVASGEVGGDGTAVLEDGDAVADLPDLLETVGDVDDGDALRGEVADHPEERLHLLLVERGRRLVHHDQLGVVAEGPGHGDDLLAGGGEGADLAVHPDLAVPEAPEQLAGRLAGVPALEHAAAGHLVPEEDVLGDAEPGDEVELLVDGGDAAGDRGVRRRERDLLAAPRDRALVGAVRAGQHLDRAWTCRRRSGRAGSAPRRRGRRGRRRPGLARRGRS